MGAPYQNGKPIASSTGSWREEAAMDKARELKSVWKQAGVKIGVIKVDGLFKISDAELDYAFKLAKRLGAIEYHCWHALTTPRAVYRVHQAGLSVSVFRLPHAESALKRILKANVDGILADDIPWFKQQLEAAQAQRR